VATLKDGGFSDYVVEKVAHVIPVAQPTPSAVVFLTSGLTASIALEEVCTLLKLCNSTQLHSDIQNGP
jgi:hypothetical protein